MNYMLVRHVAPMAALLASSAALAGAPSGFTEEAQSRGLSYLTVQDPMFFAEDWGTGLAFADLDDDGDADVVVVGRPDAVVGIFENTGGAFISRSVQNGVAPVPSATGVIAGDYDRDGDLDLFISAGRSYLFFPNDPTPNRLLRNEGGFMFTDVTVAAGLDDDGPAYGCAWSDFDTDGWLDLYVANRFTPNRLFRNLGDGTFEDVAVSLGVDRDEDPTFQASFFDFDRDGDADLYLATDRGEECDEWKNHLFENVGGTFVNITEDSGTEACIGSMCIALGDFEGNGFQDIYVTNTVAGNVLLMNQGDGTFAREEVAAGVVSNALGWGAHFFDYDHDTILDLYVCNIVGSSPDARNRLYKHDGTWPAVDVSTALGVDVESYSFAVASADIDTDGDLDLAVVSHGDPLRLFINHEGAGGNWVRGDLIGEGPQRYAIGGRVDVVIGETMQQREVIAGNNYLSQNELVVHFGLGDAPLIDEIVMSWPSGTTRTLTSMPVNQTWRLYPPDKLGDSDGDGDRDAVDLGVFTACSGPHDPGSITPGCEVMDYEGDGDVDEFDFAVFLSDVVDQGDCNGNKIPDFEEVFADPDLDENHDGIIDVCSCVVRSDCADRDLDGIRDDPCIWWDCSNGLCQETPILFSDLGGAFGACAPDGAVDGNDRFHALNCFSNTGMRPPPSSYECEDDAPAAVNVDGSGFQAPCTPDGVCDANDAFTTLNIFSGALSCSCGAGPAPAPVVFLPPAAIELRAADLRVRGSQLVVVSAFLEHDVADLRGYQLHIDTYGGNRGSLELVDMAVEDRSDAVFAQRPAWHAFNVERQQMLAGVDDSGVFAPAGAYMATFVFKASRDALGLFGIELRGQQGDPEGRSMLFPTTPHARKAVRDDAHVRVRVTAEDR